jgi:acetyltransferase-like isoleucine patch superfamily enzyme
MTFRQLIFRHAVMPVYRLILFPGKRVRIGSSNRIRNTSFEGLNKTFENCTFTGAAIGRGTYVGENSRVHHAKIGRYCSVSAHFSCGFGTHPSGFVSTHPAFYLARSALKFSFVKTDAFDPYKYLEDQYLVVIGNDVWIGYDVTILDHVKVGDGAIIAAGSIVTKDVAPYSIVAGTPAREIGRRFNDEQIQRLLELKWWDKPPRWLAQNARLFTDINNLTYLQ